MVCLLWMMFAGVMFIPGRRFQTPAVPPDHPREDLHVLGLGGWSGGFADGATAKFVVELALEHINAKPDVLPDYTLKFIWTDTTGEPGFGTFSMVQELARPPTKVMIMGSAISGVSQATAQVSCFYNLTQVSYESVSPALSDKKRYPYFFRTYAPETIVNPTRLALIKHYGWNKVANVHEADDLFTMTTDQMIPMLAQNNITLATAEVVNDNPALQMANLKKRDARIIIGGFHQYKAPQVFCEAYRNGLYGPKIVWIMTGWYVEDWWTLHTDTHDCSRAEMLEAVQGLLYTGVVTENPDLDQVGVSGYTPRQIDKLVTERAGGKEYFSIFYRFFYYDTAWTLALGLNGTTSVLKKRLTEFTYADGAMGRAIYESTSRLKFVGSLGYTEFDEFGDPSSTVEIVMQKGEHRYRVGLYTFGENGLPELVWVNGGIEWLGGRVPSDSTQLVMELVFMPWSVYLTYCIIGAVGIVVSVLFLVFNVVCRRKRVVKMSSPNLNNIILCGSIIMILTVFFYEQSQQYTRMFCSIRNFSMTLGFSLVFGALFSKTWRVHVIFASKTVQNVVISDSRLLGLVIVLVTVNAGVLVVWEVVDPYSVVLFNTGTKSIITETDDITIQYQIPSCVSNHATYFTGVLYVIQGLLLVFGAFLAWETRKVKVEALNDSHLIGTCIYNVVILSTLSVVLGLVLDTDSHLLSSLVSAFLLIATLMTESIIFIPKVMSVLQGRGDVVPKTVGDGTNNTGSTTA